MYKLKLLFEKQLYHYLYLALLLYLVKYLVVTYDFLPGETSDTNSSVWFFYAIFSAVAHQVFVWFCWRTELHFSLLTKVFGKKAFSIFSLLFSIVGLSRIVFIVLLCISTKGTLGIDQNILNVIAAVISIPAGYLWYSVFKYFGVNRAKGIDHFDKSYRDIPFVKEGIFKYTNNGMYVYGFLTLWIPALLYASTAGIVVALFSHLYIWAQFYFTEKPDFKYIYGK